MIMFVVAFVFSCIQYWGTHSGTENWISHDYDFLGKNNRMEEGAMDLKMYLRE